MKSGTNILLKICALLGLENINFHLFGHIAWGAAQGKIPVYGQGDKVKRIVSPSNIYQYSDRYFCHAHLACGTGPDLRCEPMLVSFRNPRNALISMVRWTASPAAGLYNQGQPVNRDIILRTIRHGWKDYLVDYLEDQLPITQHNTFVAMWLDFLGYLNDPSVCVVHFEDMWEERTVNKIARYLHIKASPSYVIENLGGGKKMPDGSNAYHTPSSFSGQHSNWEDWWDKEIDEAWAETDGRGLEKIIENHRLFHTPGVREIAVQW